MKFWQLLDIFRDEQSILIEVLGKPKWNTYLNYYYDIKNSVKHQNRRILDAEIDNELLAEVCFKTKKTIFFIHSKK